VEYIDSHAHTNFDVFDDDRESMYAAARSAGLIAIVEVGVGLDGSKRALARADEVELVHAATGLHPTGLEQFEEQWPEFEALVRGGGAREVGLPYIVHCREAENDLIRILLDVGYPHGVVHCFGGEADQARALVEFGMHISFCGNVTYKKNDSMREAARAVPVERLLLETDSPFLAPGKKRGKRNEPAYVVETAAYLAALKEVPLDEFVGATTTNTKRLFAL
jgi:TatD DNase family protein